MPLLHFAVFVAPQASPALQASPAFNDAPPPAPARCLLLLHGLLGSGINWRSFARRVIEADPTWAAVTVDLRMHGDSQGFAPPHTLAACAADLAALEPQLPAPVQGVLGHSLGGKVALAYAQRRTETAPTAALSHLMVLDSNPGAVPVTEQGERVEQTLQVLAALETARFPVPSHAAFWTQMEAQGVPRPIAQWLGMNLEKGEGGWHFKLQLDAIHALLADYFRADLWSALEPPPERTRIGFLIGGQSNTCAGEPLERLQRLAAAAPDRFRIEIVPRAGHWVHVDAPEETLQFVGRFLHEGTP